MVYSTYCHLLYQDAMVLGFKIMVEVSRAEHFVEVKMIQLKWIRKSFGKVCIPLGIWSF